jgi:hypothetical protein
MLFKNSSKINIVGIAVHQVLSGENIMEKSSKSKIALVNSPLVEKVSRHPFFPPLGLAYMAAVLEKNSFEVRVMDCPVCEMDWLLSTLR